jgi:hypothetical protein
MMKNKQARTATSDAGGAEMTHSILRSDVPRGTVHSQELTWLRSCRGSGQAMPSTGSLALHYRRFLCEFIHY